MTEEGTGDGVEAAALPALSPRGRVHRSGEMGIIGRDGREFCPQGEGVGIQLYTTFGKTNLIKEKGRTMYDIQTI